MNGVIFTVDDNSAELQAAIERAREAGRILDKTEPRAVKLGMLRIQSGYLLS